MSDRHVTADALEAEARVAQVPASLATVYNVLNVFAEVGLVRSLAIEGIKTIYDTNTSDHFHFFCEDTGEITDAAMRAMKFADEFEPPEGYKISKVDVIVRLRRKTNIGALNEGRRTAQFERLDGLCHSPRSTLLRNEQ